MSTRPFSNSIPRRTCVRISIILRTTISDACCSPRQTPCSPTISAKQIYRSSAELVGRSTAEGALQSFHESALVPDVVELLENCDGFVDRSHRAHAQALRSSRHVGEIPLPDQD